MAVLLCIIVAIMCVSLASIRAVNYCGAKMCEHPNSHTFCAYTPGPGPGCTGHIDAQLSPEEKARILSRINRRRSDAAGGLMRNLPPAADMLKLRWVEELAREAQRWADQCRPIQIPEENDDCRDLYSTTVGQCIASVVGEAPGLKPSSMVDVWYLQSLKYRWNATQDPPPPNSYEYADFMQMLWAKAYMVGCGRTRFMSPWRGNLRSVERLVCNFAPRGPPPGASLWTPGAPASACPPHSDFDRDLPSLCSYRSSFENSPYKHEIDGSINEGEILLKTLLQIEKNDTLNYIGSLDEFYLTKLAIATISPPNDGLGSTPLYASMKRRDVHDVDNIAHNIMNAELNHTMEYIINVNTKARNKNMTAAKISLVGRPKTYNIEELSDDEDEKSNENLAQSSHREENHKVVVDKNLYIDYDNDITRNDPENLVESKQNDKEAPDRITTEYIIQDKELEYPSTLYPEIISNKGDSPVTLYKDMRNSHATEFTTFVTINDATTRKHEHINISALLLQPLNKTEEEYLSDPETAREIQAALDKMENELSQSMPLPPLVPSMLPSQGKVRRDLRDVVPGGLQRESLKPDSQSKTLEDTLTIHSPTAELLKKNNITDEGPIYRMMQHYVPYLTQYKSTLMGASSSSTISTSILNYLALLVILVLTF